MRFDIVSVFPEFFQVLDLSLVGKARERGVLEVAAHDLRDWTDDPHRTVDDTPAGGGAGMVMRADIWGKAIDELLAGPARETGEEEAVAQGRATGGRSARACSRGTGKLREGAKRPNTVPNATPEAFRAVLAIPTPSGTPLTQRACERLAGQADRIIVACGRYEGIDARVAEHYAGRGVEVFEYSLGDYVLNGGEVAAVALVEAVGRLLPGMVGNPESLLEESHSAAGLLEYPVYTRPVEWRGLRIPEVLLGGNHREAARWRRDRSLERTAARRPDMIAGLDARAMDKKDRRMLAELGFMANRGSSHPTPMRIREAGPADVEALAALAARTFPDACPAWLGREDMDAFIAENLSAERFGEYLADPHWLVLVCEDAGEGGTGFAGYTLCLLPEADGAAGIEEGAPVNATVDGVVRDGPLVELSKFYVDRAWRGSGVSGALWRATLAGLSQRTRQWREPFVWLGTNEGNRRARKAYRKMGFEEVGERTFMVGDEPNSDVIFARRIHVA